MAFRGVYCAAKPILGRSGAIVPAGMTAGNTIPKVTAAGRGLLGGGILKTLGAVAKPLAIGSTVLAGTGAAIGLGEYLTGMPERIATETVADPYSRGADKKGYGDQLNMVQKLLVDNFVPGGVAGLVERRDEEQLAELLKNPQVRERMSYGVREPGLKEGEAEYIGATGKEYRSKKRNEERINLAE